MNERSSQTRCGPAVEEGKPGCFAGCPDLPIHQQERTGQERGTYVPRYLASEEDPPYREEARSAFQSELQSDPQDRLIPGSGARSRPGDGPVLPTACLP